MSPTPMYPLSTLPSSLVALLVVFPLSSEAFSLSWPFAKKRFTDEGLIDAASLGLVGFKGRIAALGDWNGDQFLDVFTLSDDQKTIDIWLWDHASFAFKQPSETAGSLTFPTKVTNVVPGDFNYDGKLDLLVMSEKKTGGWSERASALNIELYLQDAATGRIATHPVALPDSALAQPLIFDATGDLRPDLLGLATTDGGTTSELQLWQNGRDGHFSLRDPPLDSSKICKLANPHSNAFIDLDGDCLADIFLHCSDPRTGAASFQIWVNRQGDGFSLAKEGALPKGSGAVTFADIDRDGTLDMIFPTCASVSTSTGIGKDCYLNVVYNQQIPLCQSSLSAGWTQCRDPQDLCRADPGFDFDFSETSDSFTRVSVKSIAQTESLLMLDVSHSPPIPITLRPGDFNIDGFPDLLAILAPSTSQAEVAILRSVPCAGSKAECLHGKVDKRRRTFERLTKGASVLKKITDVRGATWVDIDEDGSLDILVQRTGKQTKDRVTYVQNNYYHDAFFLKTLVLNGVCDGVCQPANSSGSKYRPYGVSSAGASFKFTILDTSGRKAISQVAQLPQTSYLSMQTPYTLFGLGRTNNYVENLFIGSTIHTTPHFTSLEGVVPNSQVVISPPRPTPGVEETTGSWLYQLYLHPGDYVPWVTLSVVVATIGLAVVVATLHVREQREDEGERRRALHRLNLNAM